MIRVVCSLRFVKVIHATFKCLERDCAFHQSRRQHFVYQWMCTLKMYKDEEYCQLGDVNLPDLFCLIDEIVKMCHGHVKGVGVVVEADLHHSLN